MRYVVANWKMNLPPGGMDEFFAGLRQVSFERNVTLAVAPPFPFIPDIPRLAHAHSLPVGAAAQNCSHKESGPLTGEVSAQMLRQAGAEYVIVGHSERRTMFKESDEMVAQKVSAALQAQMVPLLCVGEPLDIREADSVRSYLERQLERSLPAMNRGSSVLIAYEPLWAIGTGRNATGQEVTEAVGWIRIALEARGAGRSSVLYGGSVSEENVDELMGTAAIDGFLVGGASLDPGKLGEIYRSTVRS